MDGGKMDVNSNSAFENFTGQHNLESDEEGAEDNSIEDDMEVVLDQSQKISFDWTFISGFNRKTLKYIKSVLKYLMCTSHVFVKILLHTHDKCRALLHDGFAYTISCLRYVKSLLNTNDIYVHYFKYKCEIVFQRNFFVTILFHTTDVCMAG